MVADATGFRNRDVAHLNQISACSRNVTHDFCCCGSTTGKVSIEADGSRFSNVHLTFSGNVAAGRLSDDIALKMDTLLRVAVNKLHPQASCLENPVFDLADEYILTLRCYSLLRRRRQRFTWEWTQTQIGAGCLMKLGRNRQRLNIRLR
jgi:hypothetical protein